MSVRVDQLFIKTAEAGDVESALREYVAKHGKRFVPHKKYLLEGIRQTLAILVGKRRKFVVLGDTEWSVVWEKVEYSEFADPAIGQFLSKALGVETLWLEVNEDYNLFAYQHFSKGRLVEEVFLPKIYFTRKWETEEPDPSALEAYGYCLDFATQLQKQLQLPHFLKTPAILDRSARLKRKAVEFAVFVNAKASK